MTCRVVVMLSGSGTNLQALLDAEAAGSLGSADIVGVFSNRPDAYGLTRAQDAGKPVAVVDHREYEDRAEYDGSVLEALETWQPDLIVLAGYMRIMSDTLVNAFAGRMLNIHPSLLPAYPGLHTHRRVLEAGDQEHGSTVHFVTAELDGGPLILQGRLHVTDGDTEAALQGRVQALEHQIYPRVVRWFADGRLVLSPSGEVQLDGAILEPEGLVWYGDEHSV